IKTDGNGRWCHLSPRVGAMHAVAEAARNVACTGARPIAATNCLNFGNPEKPEVMWQFTEAIDGIAEACSALGAPITGGNVSFYNETLGNPIYPTPILGVLGLIEEADCALGSGFRSEGDLILLLDGQSAAVSDEQQRIEFSSSEYAKTIHGTVAGAPPAIDLNAEKNLIDCLVELAAEKAVVSAHDLSDGGLAVALAECCFNSPDDNGACLSAEISLGGRSFSSDINAERRSGALAAEDIPAENALFGERGARAIVSLPAASLARATAIAAKYDCNVQRIGTVTRDEFRIQCNGTTAIRGEVSSLRRIWSESLAKALESA
ncbi:MAG TPA: AIR synthase related protein, partial [Candidatus Dormibacteraeota bacterium]|nr:AIR synthase related protein [Candidatus Dormibacteraeota bacterium]